MVCKLFLRGTQPPDEILFVFVSAFLQQITFNYTYRNYLNDLSSSDLISLPQGHSLVLINSGTERIGFLEMCTIGLGILQSPWLYLLFALSSTFILRRK